MYFIFAGIFLIILNIVSAAIVVKDKNAAIKKKKRISEKALILIAVLGGGIGMYLAMITVRHKTRHSLFMLGVPAITIIDAILFYFVVRIYG